MACAEHPLRRCERVAVHAKKEKALDVSYITKKNDVRVKANVNLAGNQEVQTYENRFYGSRYIRKRCRLVRI